MAIHGRYAIVNGDIYSTQEIHLNDVLGVRGTAYTSGNVRQTGVSAVATAPLGELPAPLRDGMYVWPELNGDEQTWRQAGYAFEKLTHCGFAGNAPLINRINGLSMPTVVDMRDCTSVNAYNVTFNVRTDVVFMMNRGQNLERIVAVGSDTDAPGLEHARAAGVPTFVVRPGDYDSREEWGQVLAAAIQEHGVGTGPDPGLVVSAGLMRILPAGFVREFSPRLINTHPALLPLYPGAHAVRDALAAGATETGVTVHIIDEGVDTGPTLRQSVVQIRTNESEAELHERIKRIERPLLVDTVRAIAEGDITLDDHA